MRPKYLCTTGAGESFGVWYDPERKRVRAAGPRSSRHAIETYLPGLTPDTRVGCYRARYVRRGVGSRGWLRIVGRLRTSGLEVRKVRSFRRLIS